MAQSGPSLRKQEKELITCRSLPRAPPKGDTPASTEDDTEDCITPEEGQPAASPTVAKHEHRASLATLAHDGNLTMEEPAGNVGALSRTLFSRVVGRAFTWLPVKLAIVSVFIVFFGVGVKGITTLRVGLDLKDLTPSNSYLRHSYAAMAQNFEVSFIETYVFFAEEGVEWWSPEKQIALLSFNEALQNMDSTEDTLDGMLYFFAETEQDWVNATYSSFSRELRNWLKTSLIGPNIAQNFIFHNDTGHLASWRLQVFPWMFEDTYEQFRFMVEIRQTCEEYKNSFQAVSFSDPFIFLESDLTIVQNTLTNMVAAFIAIALVSSLLIKRVGSAVMVMLMILLVDTGLFGFMAFWGLDLNILTMILLILSIGRWAGLVDARIPWCAGFSVDYTAHIAHAFTHCVGKTRDCRMVETLVLMGSPVFHGAASTLLGVLPIAFREEYILVLFYRMTTMVLLFGFFHGVVLLPVLLSWMGPFPRKRPQKTSPL